jgi:hypothetical protein
MVKKMDKQKQPARTTIADVKKEMDKPRLTESVRNEQEISSHVDRRKSSRGRESFVGNFADER